MTLLLLLAIATLMLAVLFTQATHPLAMGLILLVQTIFVCFFSGLTSKSMWFPYILFLIFLGALLVLFIYVASLAANEPFSLSVPILTTMATGLLLSTPVLWTDPIMIPAKITIETSFITPMENYFSTPTSLSLIYSPASASLTLFVILYLLLTLIVVVKITQTFLGPLRLS